MAPFRPQVWQLGGQPTVGVDVPITAMYLVLYIFGAITHMTILQLNLRKGHKFLMSGLLFGLCMARITTCTMRIASICLPNDVPLSIAASIFTAAGVVIVYIVNLIFAQRIIRAQHQHSGWSPLLHWLFVSIYVIIVLTLIMLITSVVQSFYTLNPHTRKIDRSFMLYGGTTYAIISFLPILFVLLSLTVPRRTRVDKFGSGRFRTKIAVLLLSSALVSSGAAWRAGTSWVAPVPRQMALPWYFHRACFYVFNFTVEVLVIYLYAFLRVDKRFHVPDGVRGPGSYGAGGAKTNGRGFHVYSEEETFDGVSEQDDAPKLPPVTPSGSKTETPVADKESSSPAHSAAKTVDSLDPRGSSEKRYGEEEMV